MTHKDLGKFFILLGVKLRKIIHIKFWIFLLTIIDYFLITTLVILTVIFTIPLTAIDSFSKLFTQSKKLSPHQISNTDIVHIVQAWIQAHQNDLLQVDESVDNKSVSIIIIPKNNRASSIVFDIGYDINLTILIGKYAIGFDQIDPDEYFIDINIIHQILNAYEKGNYTIKEWYLGNTFIEGKLYLNIDETTILSSPSEGTNILRLYFAKSKTLLFQALA